MSKAFLAFFDWLLKKVNKIPLVKKLTGRKLKVNRLIYLKFPSSRVRIVLLIPSCDFRLVRASINFQIVTLDFER